MRILIYGFGPYRQFRDNVTKHVLRALPARRGLKKIVFPVRFHWAQFIAAVEQHQPDIVLGLGQCGRGRLLRVETRAVNARRQRKTEKPKSIVRNKEAQLPTTLRPALGRSGRRSRFAGDYVCNFSMYVMLDLIRKKRFSTRYGFVHIPHDYDAKKAARVLNAAMVVWERGEKRAR